MADRLRRSLALSVLAALPALACRATDAPALPQDATLGLSVTPGKPGAVTELLEVVKRGGDVRLQARRTDTYGAVVAARSAALQPGDFERLWRIVLQDRLQGFDPQPHTGRQGADFGEQRLWLQWSAAAGAGRLDRRWSAPLDNDERLRALRQALAGLAAAQLPDVTLHYLR